jgi:hypothetical protein
MADKQLFELDTLSSPAGEDHVLASDTSGSNAPKKLLLSALRDFVLGTAACFNAIGTTFKLTNNMDAGQKKITNLKAGSTTGDAVNYGQVEGLITTNLPALAAPTLTQNASYLLLRSAVAPISFPHYLFYYYIDNESGTELVLNEGVVQTSAGDEAVEIASPNNMATIVRHGIMVGQYVHVAVRYRNLNSISPLSATCSKIITTEGLPDLVASISETPKEPANLFIEVLGNRVCVRATPDPDTSPGCSYAAEIIFNSEPDYVISGEELSLVQIWSNTPSFTYDLPLMQMREGYVHARICVVSLSGGRAYTDTVSHGVDYDHNFINEDFLSLIADRMSERLVTAGGEMLAPKNPK